MNVRSWLPGSVGVAALAVALVASGGGIAQADTTSGDGGVLSGNQISIPILAPISVVGNAVGVLGHATAGTTKTIVVRKAPHAPPRHHPRHHPGRHGRHHPGRHGHHPGRHSRHHPRRDSRGARTSGSGGVLSGNQVGAPVNAPISACGNAVGALGRAFGGCRETVALRTGKTSTRPQVRHHHGRHHRRHHRGSHHPGRCHHHHRRPASGASATAWSMTIA